MLNTMTHATFQYKGYSVYATRIVDVLTKKDCGWTGGVGNRDEYMIVAKSIQQFEKKFIQFVDKCEAEHNNPFDDDD